MNTTSISYDRLKKITTSFEKTSILVVGDCMIDEYLWGDVRRISPEAPVPVVEVESTSRRLGGAANVIQNLLKMKVNPVLLSLCGDDTNGVELHSMLKEMGCCVDGLLVSKNRPTTIKTRIMARHQQIVRADRERIADLTSEEAESLDGVFATKLKKVQGVIISDYGKGVISQPLIGNVIEKCRQSNTFVAIDPKDRHFDLYKGVSVITPNLKEAHAMLGLSYGHCSDDDIIALGWRILDKLSLPHLLLTLSERGMGLFENAHRTYTHLPTVARKVFDVTGAGDTVISIYTAAVTSGATPFEAAFLANHAAGLTVAELGTASVSQEELLVACSNFNTATCS